MDLLLASQWDAYQYGMVYAGLVRAKHEQDQGNPLTTGDPVYVYQNIRRGTQPAALVGPYLLLYDIGPAWHSPDLVLFEQLVLRVGRFPGRITDIPNALQALAAAYGAVGVACGNSGGRAAMSRVYERAGFRSVSHQYYKETQ